MIQNNIYLTFIKILNMAHIIAAVNAEKRKKETENCDDNKFDEDAFDRKVGKIIYNIHRKNKEMQNNSEFRKWVRRNKSELRDLYLESELYVSFNIFCNYVYKNTINAI